MNRIDLTGVESIHIMSQMCMGSCCRHNMQHWRAVNFTNNWGAFHPSHATFPDYLQNQLANWRSSSSYHPRQYMQPYNMTPQQDNTGTDSWMRTHTGREENEPLASAWANVHLSHPQPEQAYGHHSFFSDCMDYHPEEEALFIPSPAYQGSSTVPQAMNAVTASFAPQTPLENDTTTATRLLQTNVDVSQSNLVYHDDWRKASIDFADDDEDAPSPSSTEATSHGPFTPMGFDGDIGLGEAAARQLNENLSSSFDSLSSDPLEGMFKDVTVSSSQSFDPLEASRRYHHVGASSGSMGPHYGHQVDIKFAGLSFSSRSMHSLAQNRAEVPFVQGSFRDLHGLPTEAKVPLPDLKPLRVAQGAIEPLVTKSTNTRKDRDQFLLDMRGKGFTYKEIKESGEFTEAESTLRGRVRVLTKARFERVRKPEWTDRDIRLLRRGVAYVLRQPTVNGTNKRRRTGKLPWKDVSSYICQHGGSYSFAPATCAKKWDDVARDG